jgi:putative transposase
MDNGPELILLALMQFAEEHGIFLGYYLFRTMKEAREITECWLAEYNSEKPNEFLDNLMPE